MHLGYHVPPAPARVVAATLLHDPIVALKERSEPGTGRVHARILAELLRLDLGDARDTNGPDRVE